PCCATKPDSISARCRFRVFARCYDRKRKLVTLTEANRMVMSVALEDAKAGEYRIEGDGTNLKGGSSIVPLFGSPTNRNGGDAPQAFLSQGDPSRATRAHFHALDQFQIVMKGKGRLGRHDLIPYGVHFARAYTPYGPLVADAVGMTHLTLRAH